MPVTLSLKHTFQSAKGDGVDSTLVQPSNWNAEHTLSMATARILGRVTAGTGVIEELTAAQVSAFILSAMQTSLALGSLATLSTILTANITDAQVTNAKLASVATATFKGRTTALTGVPEDLTVTQATALLNAVVGDSGAGGTKGLVPAPGAGEAAANKFLKASGGFAALPISPAPDVILEDQKASGTAGGAATPGSDVQRALTVEVRDPSGLCTLLSNQFTLLAGSYYIEWSAPAVDVDQHQTILRNVTGSVDLKRGTSEGRSSSSGVQTRSVGQHVVTIAGPITFELRHRITTSKSVDGFGAPGGFGTELYSFVYIWKVA